MTILPYYSCHKHLKCVIIGVINLNYLILSIVLGLFGAVFLNNLYIKYVFFEISQNFSSDALSLLQLHLNIIISLFMIKIEQLN